MRSPNGFTLVEVVVALAVGAMVVLAAHAMLGQAGDGAERIGLAAAEGDRDGNAETLARDMVARAEVRYGAADPFVGAPNGARWTSWCEVPAGWLEPCRASLGVIQVAGRNVLALSLPHDQVVVVRRGFRAGELLYLRDMAGGGTWLREWRSAVAAPLAVGVVMDGDTLILRIGERG